MKVEPKILQFWQKLKEHGDCMKIAELCGSHRVRISRAINHGKCNSNEYVAINNYFGDKQRRIQESRTNTKVA